MIRRTKRQKVSKYSFFFYLFFHLLIFSFFLFLIFSFFHIFIFFIFSIFSIFLFVSFFHSFYSSIFFIFLIFPFFHVFFFSFSPFLLRYYARFPTSLDDVAVFPSFFLLVLGVLFSFPPLSGTTFPSLLLDGATCFFFPPCLFEDVTVLSFLLMRLLFFISFDGTAFRESV